MAKRRQIDETEFQTIWKGLPQSDKRFINALIVITETIGDETLRYHELPTRLERTLRKADRDTLFSVMVECVALLLDAPAMGRVKRSHRRRGNGAPARTETKHRKTARAVLTRRGAKRSRSK
jgi:hypothetical protein